MNRTEIKAALKNLRVNTPQWWNMKGRGYDSKGDRRCSPDEYKPVVRRCESPVLEIGSAFGALRKFLPLPWSYVGVEISEYMVNIARKEYPHDTFIHGDIRLIGKHLTGAFNTVVALQVLEHFQRPERILTLLREIATKRLVFSVPNDGFNKVRLEDDGHVSWWKTENDVRQAWGRFGEITFFKGPKNHHCGVIEWASQDS